MKLKFDEIGKRIFETGVKYGVLFPQDANGAYPLGVAWNGLTAVTESPSGAEPSPFYADNIKYLNLMSQEEFAGTIEAYTYPDEFAVCDGSAEIAEGVYVKQQTRKAFGLCYRTSIGNDVDGADHGYKLHIVYGALAAPSESSYSSVNESPEPMTFSWEFSTTPVSIPGFKPSATIVIDSTKVDAAKLAAFEKIIYGVDADAEAEPPVVATVPRLPLPSEIIELFPDVVG